MFLFRLLLITLLPSTQLVANDFAYRWVDQSGVTNFSDTPPESHSSTDSTIESISLPKVYSSAINPEYDYYSIDNQWQRMHEERIERDKIILEKHRVELERSRTNATTTEQPVTIMDDPYLYGGIPYIVNPFIRDYHHNRHHYRPKKSRSRSPEKPSVRKRSSM